jgi:transglutaminase-like putative cysteine protease
MSSQVKLSVYGAVATMAASLSLLSVFASAGWLLPVMGAVVIVSGSCALVRRSPLPSVVEPVAAALGVLLWMTVLDAHSQARLGVIPSGASFTRLGQVARTGFSEVHKLPTPVPPHQGLVLLTVVGVAAVALVVDLMTVTLRRAALSGLPLFALFTVCAATGHHGVGVFPFIVAAAGYLWLLYADNRDKVTRWGAAVGTGSRARPASAWSTDMSVVAAPASLGRQVGAVAVSLSLVVPLFIPGLHTGINKHGGSGSGGSGGGGGSVQTFDPIVKVSAFLTHTSVKPVLTYRTSATDPGYLRLTSLDQFNGVSFSSASLTAPASAAASNALAVAVPPLPGSVVTTSLNVQPSFAVRWLPLQSTALGVSVGDQWRYDPGSATVFSATATTGGLRYTERSVGSQPSAARLASAGAPEAALDADLALPRIAPGVRTLTKQITAGATSRYQAALDIQRFFTGGGRFTYDTSIAPDSTPDALANFLLHTRRGFCQQYATAMAVMARLSGIPSRVAVGFTRGKQQPDGSWSVDSHDAHAWPELWFQGLGWLPFEPTPRADGQAVTPAYAAAGSQKVTKNHAQNNQGRNRKHRRSATSGVRRVNAPGSGGGQAVAASGHHGTTDALAKFLLIAVLILIGLALIVPGIVRVVLRRQRWRHINNPVHAAGVAWAELRDTAVDYGAPWDDARSPRQIAATLVDAFGVAATSSSETRASMLRLARCEEEARYARRPGPPATDLRRDVAVVRSAARARRSGPQRLVAVMMPRSTVLLGYRALSRLGDAVERLNRLGAPVRRVLRNPLRVARS